LIRDQLNNGPGRVLSPAEAAERARRLNRATSAAAVEHAGTGLHLTCVTVNINMEFKHPNYYAALRKQGRKPKGTSCPDDKIPSVQAGGDKHPSPEPKAQASSQSSQAPGSDDQGTSAQAHGPGCKQRG